MATSNLQTGLLSPNGAGWLASLAGWPTLAGWSSVEASAESSGAEVRPGRFAHATKSMFL